MTLEEAWNASRGENRCHKMALCGFEPVIYTDAIVESCRFCGKRLIYNVVDGTIDQARSLRNHIRDTVQPFGATQNLFVQLYGYGALTPFLKKAENRGDPRQGAKEDLKTMAKLSDRGYNDRDLAKWRA